MSNIKELISKHPEAENVLKRAGKIAFEDEKLFFKILCNVVENKINSSL